MVTKLWSEHTEWPLRGREAQVDVDEGRSRSSCWRTWKMQGTVWVSSLLGITNGQQTLNEIVLQMSAYDNNISSPFTKLTKACFSIQPQDA
ncbi:hypothetical protein P5673_002679, partial [Acropora cervicornis]